MSKTIETLIAFDVKAKAFQLFDTKISNSNPNFYDRPSLCFYNSDEFADYLYRALCTYFSKHKTLYMNKKYKILDNIKANVKNITRLGNILYVSVSINAGLLYEHLNSDPVGIYSIIPTIEVTSQHVTVKDIIVDNMIFKYKFSQEE